MIACTRRWETRVGKSILWEKVFCNRCKKMFFIYVNHCPSFSCFNSPNHHDYCVTDDPVVSEKGVVCKMKYGGKHEKVLRRSVFTYNQDSNPTFLSSKYSHRSSPTSSIDRVVDTLLHWQHFTDFSHRMGKVCFIGLPQYSNLCTLW